MFINNINPVLFSLGPFGVRFYGLVYSLGFLATYFFLRYHSKKGSLKLNEDQLDSYFIWLIIGSIFMARVFEVFVYNFPEYSSNLWEFFRIWDGGMAYQGGIIGAVAVTLFFGKKYNVKFYEIMDLLVIPAALALVFGKIANYFNSELYGTITNPQSTPWCVVFVKVDSYCRHPSQIYEAISILIIFGVLLWIYLYQKKHKKHDSGILFWTFIGLYGLLRFLLTFLRDEPLYLGLNIGQWISLVLILLSGWFLYRIWTHKSKNI
jgi:phosphatidylglycerol---prolipoprotein diacylglyceryl transferase